MKPLPIEPDPVIEAYKKDIDRTLLRQNLRRSVDERVANLIAMARWMESRKEERESNRHTRQTTQS